MKITSWITNHFPGLITFDWVMLTLVITSLLSLLPFVCGRSFYQNFGPALIYMMTFAGAFGLWCLLMAMQITWIGFSFYKSAPHSLLVFRVSLLGIALLPLLIVFLGVMITGRYPGGNHI